MGKPLSGSRVKARKPHGCFLCPIDIEVGEVHDRWGWAEDGRVTTMRAHDACKSYAHDCVDGWTNGDGVSENAVYDHIAEEIGCVDAGGRHGSDKARADAILATWPGLSRVIDRIVSEYPYAEVNDG